MVFANAGQMRNYGVELLLDARIVQGNRFRWNATFVGAHNVNDIVSVSSDQFFGSSQPITNIGLGWGQETQILAAGQPVGAFCGKAFAGLTEEGKWLFYNNEGDVVTSDQVGDEDFRHLGNSIPLYNVGLTNTFAFGRFDASILIRGAFGFKVLNSKNIFHDNINNFGATNMLVSAFNWAPDPDYPTTGRPVPLHTGEPTFSDYYLERGDYLKLDNVTIGYTFPFHNLRLYVSTLNLAILTNYSGMDPELGINPFPGAGVEFRNYFPRTRTFTFGLSATF
ncbi:hypothetical protein BH24BAC1_BH24BAC1_27420 [soil metagenome]